MHKTKLMLLGALGLITVVVVTIRAQDQPPPSQPAPNPPAQSDETRRANDAVDNAQLPQAAATRRPEQQKNEHDRSGVFAAANAPPSSPVFASQPERLVSEQRPGRLSHDPGELATLLRSAGQGALEPVWDRLPSIDVPVLAMAKGLAKTEGDGALTWVGELGADGAMTVNGLPLGKAPL